MVLDLLTHLQSTDLGFQLAVLSGVALAYIGFELVVSGAMQRRVRAR